MPCHPWTARAPLGILAQAPNQPFLFFSGPKPCVCAEMSNAYRSFVGAISISRVPVCGMQLSVLYILPVRISLVRLCSSCLIFSITFFFGRSCEASFTSFPIGLPIRSVLFRLLKQHSSLAPPNATYNLLIVSRRGVSFGQSVVSSSFPPLLLRFSTRTSLIPCSPTPL